jgi:putative flippase GtrA
MNNPIFIPSLFSKVIAVILALAIAVILAVVLIAGEITTLDLAGTLICAVIISYIVHLWIYYWKRPEGEEES